MTHGEATALIERLLLLLDEFGETFPVVLVKFMESIGYSDTFLKPSNRMKSIVTIVSCHILVT